MSPLYYLSSIRNNFTSKKDKYLPRAITVYFFILTFAFGMDFGFIKMLPHVIHSISKIISTLVSLFVFLILIIPLDITYSPDYFWYIIVALQFSCYCIILKCSKYTVRDFLMEMHNVDEDLCQINKFKIGLIVYIYSCIIYFTRIGFTYYDCEFYFPGACDVMFIPWPIYSIPAHGIDFVFVVLNLIYLYIYYCIKDANDLLKYDMNISKLKNRYTAILKIYEKIRPLYEKLIIVGLLEIPKMLGLIYNMIKYIVEDHDVGLFLGECIYGFISIMNITVSGAIVQMVIFQVDDLKTQLNNMLLDEDAKKSDEIYRVLKYVKACKLWRPVAGVVPVDMKLVTAAISIFATYLIVIVQFTHLVDKFR